MPVNRQSWNNLISYVKRKLGTPLNLLEYSDDDIKRVIQEDVLPAMSQYIGKPCWIRLNSSDRIKTDEHGLAYELYKIQVPDDIVLVDIQDVYYHRDNMGTLGIYQNMLAVLDPRDTVMTNEFLDMLNSLETVQAFDFIAPDKIRFERPLNGKSVILECKAEHSDLHSIPSDYYHEILKPWCVAEVMENIVAMRNKFQTLSTPLADIQLNVADMANTAAQLKQMIMDKLDATPPDHLVYIF